jgi:DNA-binding NarL/FixJ family response regulator
MSDRGQNPGPLRVVVADDDLLVRRGIVSVLAAIDQGRGAATVTATGPVEVVAEAGSLDELLAAVDHHEPDVVVTDIRMPPSHTDEGIQAAGKIRARLPSCGVVVLSQHADPAYVTSVFEAGSDGVAYLLKENVGDISTLARAIIAVADGGSAVDPQVVSALVAGRPAKPDTPSIENLTPRETDVLRLIAEGLNNSAIAEQLVLSDRAVAKHINSIFSKLHLGEEPDAHRRVRAVLIWLAAAD